MKGIKVVFEFNKIEVLTREKFEENIINCCKEEGIRVEHFWCVLDKVVILPDFPVSYNTNECIVEINVRDEENVTDIYNIFVEKLREIESFYNTFKVTKVKYEEVKIRNSEEQSTENKRVFVTGVTGQLGHDVMNQLYELGFEPIGSGMSLEYSGVQDGTPVTRLPYISLDITNPVNIKKVITEIKPAVVIHCAAWNSVDRAEDKNKVDWVRSTNVSGTQSIADACAQIDAKMVYISTDYVFDGSGDEPWMADSKDYKALNVYGQTKLEGELAVSETLDKYFIVRTSWAYGINGDNFVKAMLNIAMKTNTIRVVNDQIGTPTYMKDLAELVVDMISTEKYGYYNATNEGGFVSWYEFACEIFKQANIDVDVYPVSTQAYGVNTAKRPQNSRLDKSKLVENGFKQLPDWKDAIGRYLVELENYSVIMAHNADRGIHE